MSESGKLVIRIINKLMYRQVKEDSKVGSAVISDNCCNMYRTPYGSSIFSAEAKAVDLAIAFIRTCDTNNKLIIIIVLAFSIESYEPIHVQIFHSFKNF